MTIEQKYKELHQLINDMESKHLRILNESDDNQKDIEQDSFDELLIELFERNVEIGNLLGSKRNNKRTKKNKRSIKKKRTKEILKKISTGGKYNKHPNRWWNKNLLHSLLLLDPGFTKISNQPKYTFNNSIEHVKPGDYLNDIQEKKPGDYTHDNPYTKRITREHRKPIVYETKDED